MQSVLQHFAHGWDNDSDYWDDNQKQALLRIYEQHHDGDFPYAQPPMIIQPNNFTATTTTKRKVRTYASAVMVPSHLKELGKMIMDYLSMTKEVIPQYIPVAHQTYDPDGFCGLLAKHNLRLANHRNIQINTYRIMTLMRKLRESTFQSPSLTS